MRIKKVWALYFSPTETTQRVVTTIAKAAAESLGLSMEVWDITLPERRKTKKQFGQEDLVILGTPVYAGRVPNLIVKDLKLIKGEGSLAVSVVCYGNRSFDDALIELRDILEDGGFHTVAAGAFIGEHSFSKTLAAGRPDERDLRLAEEFGRRLAENIPSLLRFEDERKEEPWPYPPVAVSGTPRPYGGYYQPRDRRGVFIDIRRVKPLTSKSCDECGLCAAVCPMGAIEADNVKEVSGICIKCGACIKKCPKQAKYYDDAGYLYHKEELELGLVRRAEPEVFFCETGL